MSSKGFADENLQMKRQVISIKVLKFQLKAKQRQINKLEGNKVVKARIILRWCLILYMDSLM